jgi:PAS domain S-box-containing protein
MPGPCIENVKMGEHPTIGEGEVREAEDRFRSIFECSRDGIIFADLNGFMVELNTAFSEMIGYSKEELLAGRTFLDLTPPDYLEITQNRMARLRSTGEPVEYEKEYVRKDGTRLPVSVTIVFVKNRAGRPIGFAANVQDMTEKKLADEALRRSEYNLRMLAETIPQLVWICGPDGSSEYCNQRWYEYTGLGPAESAGLGWLAAFHPQDAAALMGAWQGSSARAYEREGRIRCARDGTYRWHLVRARTILSDSGSVPKWFGTCTDIDAMRQKNSIIALLQVSAAAANEAGNTSEALQLCVDRVCQHTGWDVGHAYVLRTDGKDGFLPGAAWHLAAPEAFAAFRAFTEGDYLALEIGLAGRIMRSGEPLYVPELSEDPHFTRASVAAAAGLKAAFGFPILCGKEVVAVLEFFSGKPMELEEPLLQALASVGTQLCRVFERERSEISLRRLSAHLLRSQDEERRRIARELHDSSGQYLAALQMNLDAVAKSPQLSPKVVETLAECSKLARFCTTEMRTISYLLHPPLLDEMGLASAVKWYATGFAERSSVAVELDIPAELDRLPRGVELALFRVVQEALTNIHRHSGSKTVRIRITANPRETTLEVSDSGRGMSLHSPHGVEQPRAGVGIVGMRERMKELGGVLEIISTAHGTTVRAVVPLPRPDSQPALDAEEARVAGQS